MRSRHLPGVLEQSHQEQWVRPSCLNNVFFFAHFFVSLNLQTVKVPLLSNGDDKDAGQACILLKNSIFFFFFFCKNM